MTSTATGNRVHHNARNVMKERHARPPLSIDYPAIVHVFVYRKIDCPIDFWENGGVDLCSVYELEAENISEDCIIANNNHTSIKWERHTEFVSVTIVENNFNDLSAAATKSLELPNLPIETPTPFLSLLIGVEKSSDPILSQHTLFRWGEESTVRLSSVLSGTTILASDFEFDNQGRTRILVSSECTMPHRMDRHIQRLIEIEYYTAFVLLAWDTVREISPMLEQADQQLHELVTAISSADNVDDRALLSRLAKLAADHEASIASTNFRLNASLAYFDIVSERLDELNEKRVDGVQRFCSFIRRRAIPASKTYSHILKRQEEISERIYRATQLLRSRIDVELASQSQQQLTAMNHRAEAQYKLQKTVEGLSTIAISYYLIGILAYAGKALSHYLPNWTIIEHPGILAPAVLLIVWLGLRRLSHS